MITWEILVLLFGFTMGFILYIHTQYRAGGVLIVPLLTIYFLKYPLMTIILIIVSFVNWIILEIIYNKLKLYGRKLMYISFLIGIILILIVMFLLSNYIILITWYPILLIGMIAYNFHREKHSKVDTTYSLFISSMYFIVLLIVGTIGMVMI